MKELCAENIKTIKVASRQGIDRIELCSHLDLGGLTPEKELFLEARAFSQKKEIKLMTMIRPHAKSFIYNDKDLCTMCADIQWFKEHHTDGVVFGCLTKENNIDKTALERLVAASQALDITFHMAFDEIPVNKQQENMALLHDYGIKRILTHGGKMTDSIESHLDHLNQLISWAQAHNITIMPGGGITYKNLASLQKKLSTSEWHGTKIVGEFDE